MYRGGLDLSTVKVSRQMFIAGRRPFAETAGIFCNAALVGRPPDGARFGMEMLSPMHVPDAWIRCLPGKNRRTVEPAIEELVGKMVQEQLQGDLIADEGVAARQGQVVPAFNQGGLAAYAENATLIAGRGWRAESTSDSIWFINSG